MSTLNDHTTDENLIDRDDPLSIILADENVRERITKQQKSTKSTKSPKPAKRSKTMKQQSMSDISHVGAAVISVSNVLQTSAKLEEHRATLLAARKHITTLEAARTAADKALARVKAKGAYLKGQAFDDELEHATHVCANLAGDYADAVDAMHTAQRVFEHTLQTEALVRIGSIADTLSFGIPVSAENGGDARSTTDYVTLRLNILGGIARTLQDTMITGQDYFERELHRAYGEPNAEGSQQGTKPEELAQQSFIRVEQLKTFREFVTAMRMAVEGQFIEALDKLPDEATYRPRMLWQTDAEAKQRYDERQVQRREKKREEVKGAMNAEIGITRSLETAYQPRPGL